MTLYLLNYNNYYNRIVKQEENLSAYLNYAIPFSTEKTGIEGVNFNPNDGVDTEQIINWNNTIPDYLVVADNNDIRSRWFITEMARTRGGQYKLTLHRDVIVDNYINVLNAHIFVDKAKVPDTDIAIYNKEPYKFNKIKQSETLLKDETGCAWIVGYLSQQIDQSQTEIPVKAYLDDSIVQYTVSDLDDYYDLKFSGLRYADIVGRPNARKIFGYAPVKYSIRTYAEQLYVTWNLYDNTSTMGYAEASAPLTNDFCTQKVDGVNDISFNYQMYKQAKEQFEIDKAAMSDYAYSILDTNNVPSLNFTEENGKIIKDTSTNKYYAISVVEERGFGDEYVIGNSTYPGLYGKFENIRTACSGTSAFGSIYSLEKTYEGCYKISMPEHTDYIIEFVEVSFGLNVQIPQDDDRPHLVDAPYDMFCMPYSDSIKFYNGSSLVGTSSKTINLAAAMSMVEAYVGAGAIYDVQLLPYCPLDDNYLTANGDIQLEGQVVGTISKMVEQDRRTFGYVLFTKQSTFSISVPVNIEVDDYKMQHQLDNWRFNSPNWSGSYDFDVTLNKGLSYVDIDCTYKPYTPYIHVCPRFNDSGYYGYNNKDAVGLICGGDFSLPMVSDQWKTYEYQNKNYQNQFDRQIQNINTNYRFDTYERGANALTGIVSGAASGAVAGAAAGPAGMVGGAVAGGVLSTVGGVADMILASKRKEETVSYATDQFNYQIDNIKSLPYTLSKVSALNGNNKLFPFIEHFSASDQEKIIFQNLVKWNGMTVNRVDTLSTFIDEEKQYFSGRLIRIDIEEDFHMVAAIANELSKGVFV